MVIWHSRPALQRFQGSCASFLYAAQLSKVQSCSGARMLSLHDLPSVLNLLP